MPTTPQVNTQQVLQMGTHTEKVQQTTQSIGNVTAQQLNKEREVVDEMKRNQVHETNITYFVEETDPKTRSKKRVRVQKKQAHAYRLMHLGLCNLCNVIWKYPRNSIQGK